MSSKDAARLQINFRIDAKLHKELEQLVHYIQGGGFMEGPVHYLGIHNGQSITTLAKAMVTQAVEHALPIVKSQYDLCRPRDYELEQHERNLDDAVEAYIAYLNSHPRLTREEADQLIAQARARADIAKSIISTAEELLSEAEKAKEQNPAPVPQ